MDRDDWKRLSKETFSPFRRFKIDKEMTGGTRETKQRLMTSTEEEQKLKDEDSCAYLPDK